MKFLLSPLLIGALAPVSSTSATSIVKALRGGASSSSSSLAVASSSSQQQQDGEHKQKKQERVLMENMSGFAPLTCNNNMQPCILYSTKAYNPTSSKITISCGECIIMDYTSSSTSINELVLPHGLDIQGKLVFPDGYKLTLRTPFVFVQGILEMTSSRATSNEADVKIVLTGEAENQYLIPHDENAALCPIGGCAVGNRPIIVAGGTLNIQGLSENCPTWQTLKNVIQQGLPSDESVSVPQYISPPTSTSSSSSGSMCSDVIIETDFENNQGIGWPNLWYRNYGGSESYVSETTTVGTTASTNTYTQWSGRTSNWNGPQTNFDPYCIIPEVEYFVKAKVKLVGITEYSCVKLISYMYDLGGAPEKKWNWRGQACTTENDTWFDFSSVTTFDERTANPIDPNNFSRRLYWEGPPPGVDIVLDDVKIFRLPASGFPDTSAGGICSELLLNGDAQDTTIHPLTYPFLPRPGGSYTVTIGSEQGDIFGETNYYYAVRNRQYGYDMPRPKLWTDCVQKGNVYSISLDLRVHSSTKKTFRVQLTVKQEDGSESYPWLVVCPPADIQDGWVHCSGNYEFSELDGSATSIDWYLLSDDDATSDVDIDNISMSFKNGPITGLVLEDANGELASCWGTDSEILLTSPSLTFDDVQTPTIAASTMNSVEGTTTLQLAEPIGATSFADNEPNYAVEVALLSRNIVFESDNIVDADKGGHLMVLHTPHVAQTLQGVALRKFGQAGNLGRYPVHFHMCGCVHGSLIAKNIVRESNQRCYVIHGSHNVTMDSNVAYDTHGHCFMLEDSGEMDNTFIGNLAAVTRDALTLIRPEETDDNPSSFWITNPKNTFVGNVAAGSEHSGFWFEMKSSVRAPTKMMSEELSKMNPSIMPLTLFEDNIAHSNHEHGVKTYPGAGLEPEGDPAVFKNTKSYRNRQSGVFIHNSRNINIEGGIFADNAIGIDVDRSPTCSVLNATIIGYSPEYRALATQANLHRICPSSWPIRGVELHTFWHGGDLNTGTRVEGTSFSHFGDSGCAGSTALRIDPENKGYFDVRTTLSGLSFAPDSEPLSSCDAIYATGEEMGAIDDVAIQDLDGSIIGTSGYIVADNARMTVFSPGCTPHQASCLAHCPGVCFRTMGLDVSTFEDASVELEITDTDTGVKTSFTGEYDLPLNEDGTINLAEHTKTHRRNRFFATLPSSGNYEARFIKDGQTHWPLYVKMQYEDPGHNCPEFASFTVVEPEVEPGYCDELIRNGDVSAGVEGWWATMGGVATIDESASGQGLAITSEYRTANWMGPAQYFDSRCVVEGFTYRVSAKVKLVHKTTGEALSCGSAEGFCPKWTMKIESGAWEDIDEGWFGMAWFGENWDSSLEWNTLESEITITQKMATAGSVLMYSECGNMDALMVWDDVSVQRVI